VQAAGQFKGAGREASFRQMAEQASKAPDPLAMPVIPFGTLCQKGRQRRALPPLGRRQFHHFFQERLQFRHLSSAGCVGSL